MEIKLPEENKRKLISDVQGFFSKEYDEQIGIIAAEKVIDFFVSNLGTQFYLKAMDDIKAKLATVIEDIDADCYPLYKKLF
ncbi:MAG: DUF2164 domain-containing protein [Candidatus Margulisiibacteriota bacterium]|nr:MAG: hypothetical protein A2X43_05325 [Candidatus Margulisbacteria bacterium GWD2_39_127]OGI03436.1 MAG: hypothetical protein A2X42_05150 [Candidatus Margulisbacteria bacterium GWF2_38_17]OGI05625.1 MAG: hypothetical protein A2X41_06050 [Candidatus Margulisbacteria bacterium GWE2_39_32]PZM83964.1 MAG: DUF2164 domain-containing protein [Candidatus Margulisiibacteriota bacterium]HAR64462.1 DUF2164 domain-containing protein [Candidatus Margulisiibacteriota bacterium]